MGALLVLPAVVQTSKVIFHRAVLMLQVILSMLGLWRGCPARQWGMQQRVGIRTMQMVQEAESVGWSVKTVVVIAHPARHIMHRQYTHAQKGHA